ncbi:MAG TPA: DUF72 domain-containing protein [Lysobacter sp.]|nr:DUF72 domain-containing protein [Lysobacter sp.]
MSAADRDDDASPQGCIRVGIGGWSYAPWRDNFYPAGLVQRQELEYASRRLGTIEINSTFYRAQKPATYARWAAQTPEDFVFAVKAPHYVTQRGALADAGDAANRFLTGGLAELGRRLGPVLWQLAPNRPFDADELHSFLDALPDVLDGHPIRHALEVRHASFREPEFVALARQRGIATVFTDSSDHPSLADITGDFVYARLMQTRDDVDTGYGEDEIAKWARFAGEWARGSDPETLPHVGGRQGGAGPREVFVFFIGGAKHRNPAAALALIEQLRAD